MQMEFSVSVEMHKSEPKVILTQPFLYACAYRAMKKEKHKNKKSVNTPIILKLAYVTEA